METMEKHLSEIEQKIQSIEKLIAETELKGVITYDDYKTLQDQLNKIQLDIVGEDAKLLEQFEARMQAIYEKVEKKPE